MVLVIVALVLINPSSSVTKSSRSQFSSTSADVLASASVVNRIAAAKFAEDGVRPLVDTVISGQKLLGLGVLLKTLLVPPSGRRLLRIAGCRRRSSFHSVTSAAGENDRFESFAFLVVQHLASALALLRRRRRSFRSLLFVDVIFAETQCGGQCLGQSWRWNGRRFQTAIAAVIAKWQHPMTDGWLDDGRFRAVCAVGSGTFETGCNVIHPTRLRRRSFDSVDRIKTALRLLRRNCRPVLATQSRIDGNASIRLSLPRSAINGRKQRRLRFRFVRRRNGVDITSQILFIFSGQTFRIRVERFQVADH